MKRLHVEQTGNPVAKNLRRYQRIKSFLTVFLALSLIFVVSCRYRLLALKPDQVDAWLTTVSGGEAPQIDITGKWHDPQAWGEGYLRQEQNKITGIIGSYNIKGIVSGKIVYLVFLYSGYVYYTARLEMYQDILTGNYFKAIDKKQKRGYPVSLEKKVEPAIKL